MPDPNLLRNESDVVAEKLTRRDFKLGVDELGALEECRKILQVKTKNLQVERNSRSKPISQAKARGEDTEPSRLEVNKLGEELDAAEAELDALQTEIRDIALTIPNLPVDEVPVGKDENDNVGVSRWGTPRGFDFEVHGHVTLGKMHFDPDFAATIKLTDSRFVVTKEQIARMRRALSQFILNLHTEQHGYSENYAPYLVNQGTLYGTGQLLKFVGDLPRTRPLEEEAGTGNYALIPAAEVPLTNLVRGEIIGEDDLSTKTTAHIPCFRSEADSYGRDTRDLIRMHQFDKVEMAQIVRPEDSMAALEETIGHAEKVLQLLGPLYRKITLRTGDTGFGACKTYDLEVWVPAQNTYCEISSCSNVWDFQACHMQVRCRSKSDKRTRLVHTLDSSGLTVDRTLVVVMENYQQVDGRIGVPEVLRLYMNGLEHIG